MRNIQIKNPKTIYFRKGKWEGGLWVNDKDSTEHPIPIPRKYPWKGQKQFLKKLQIVENSVDHEYYKGWSTCRVCGEKNGSITYKSDCGWEWPCGLSHYVEDHNVRPKLSCIKFIMNF